jgi:predicted kinase
MEAIIFCGIQGAGKSTFFKERFFQTHVRISLDLLRTRRREKIFLAACLESGQRFVVDNTNPTRAERAVYIQAAKSKKFSVVGYYFSFLAEDAMARNALRPGKERVPDIAVKGTLAKLERPSLNEGFDALYHVAIVDGECKVSEWNDEI